MIVYHLNKIHEINIYPIYQFMVNGHSCQRMKRKS